MSSQEEAFVLERKMIRLSLFSPLNARQFDSWGGEEENRRLNSSCVWARATYCATGGANSST